MNKIKNGRNYWGRAWEMRMGHRNSKGKCGVRTCYLVFRWKLEIFRNPKKTSYEI